MGVVGDGLRRDEGACHDAGVALLEGDGWVGAGGIVLPALFDDVFDEAVVDVEGADYFGVAEGDATFVEGKVVQLAAVERVFAGGKIVIVGNADIAACRGDDFSALLGGEGLVAIYAETLKNAATDPNVKWSFCNVAAGFNDRIVALSIISNDAGVNVEAGAGKGDGEGLVSPRGLEDDVAILQRRHVGFVQRGEVKGVEGQYDR